jgi:hypothetical protein
MKPPVRTESRLRRAAEIKARKGAWLRGFPNVTGIGVGLKEVGGKPTKQVAVRVYVSKKVPRRQLSPEHVLPEQIEGVLLDVIEDRFYAHAPADHKVRHPLLKGGVSIGNLLLGGSGTLAASVFDNISGQQMILSNWHVLCGRFDCQVGEPIIQPGTGGGDPGTGGDVIARLARWALTDEIDAAVAFLSGHRFCTDELFELGRISTEPGVAQLSMTVSKSGRTTGATMGTITDLSADVTVNYGPGIGHRELRDQLIIQDGNEVSLPGDSGSLWVDSVGRAVGLNFAGNLDGTRGIANPIAAVLSGLNINFGPGATLQDHVVQMATV